MEIAGQDAELPEIRQRTRYIAAFMALIFTGLAARLFYLQVIEGDAFYKVTAESIVRTVVLPASRGEIRDRKGRVLATTVASYDVHVVPAQTNPETYARLRSYLGAEGEDLPTWEELQAKGARARDKTVVVAEDVPRDVMAMLETSLDNPGVKVVAVPRRHYPQGTLAAHALGYMNEITAEELRARKDDGYTIGEHIGRSGVERQWEPYLRGQRGFEKLVVDRRGIRRADVKITDLVEGATKQEPQQGNNVILTVDADAQRITERALRNARAGAAVVIEVDTGRILAIASRPVFDPTQMSGRLKPDASARILSDPLRPFRDKALADVYNPGSTFKAISALAALEEKLVTPDDRIKCGGFVQVGRRRFRCMKAHGVVGLYTALVQSCNSYFYDLGARPGMMNRLARFATEFGLGAPSGLGLNGEQGGFIATEEWHRNEGIRNPRHEGFVVGHALNAAIGEGTTRVTVTQMALLYAAIANGGKLWLPQLVDRIEGAGGQVIEEFPPRVRRDVSVSPESLQIVRRALYGVVHEPKGTAFEARSEKIEIAGKTGTAQVGATRRKNGEAPAAWEQVAHAWFAGYAPAGKPRIAFAVLVEHGGHGGDVAAPIASEIVDGYFDTVVPPQEREVPRIGLVRPGRFTQGPRPEPRRPLDFRPDSEKVR